MNVKEQYEDARQRLLQIPGVVSVGFGFKQKGKEITSQFGLRVYVDRKKKPEEVDVHELIPSTINGIQTDVLTAFRIVDQSNNAIRPLRGGIMLSQYNGTSLARSDAQGTLGCIARKKDDLNFVVLTNQHILEYTEPIDENHIVRQPERTESTFKNYENIVGPIVNGKRGIINYSPAGSIVSYECYIDCAIALINENVSKINYVDEIGILHGSQDLVSQIAESNPDLLKVKKKGMLSGLTTGTISEYDFHSPDGVSRGEILIDPDPSTQIVHSVHRLIPGQADDIKTYFRENAPNITITERGENIMIFSCPSFSGYGDSGSVIILEPPLNSSDFKVIGLLRAGAVVDFPIRVLDQDLKQTTIFIPNGKSIASYIGPVLEQMNIEILSGNIPVRGQQINIDKIVNNEEAAFRPELNDIFISLQSELELSDSGNVLLSIIKLHSNELISLVHHHRPVKVLWHRYKCPAFAASILAAIQHHDRRFVRLSEGVSLSEAAENLLKAINKSAGKELKQAITDYGNYFLEIIEQCNSYEEVIQFLKKTEIH